MKKLKKVVKIWAIYALITGYCCHITNQLVDMSDPEYGIGTGKEAFEFPWKHIFDNCKVLFNRLKRFIKEF